MSWLLFFSRCIDRWSLLMGWIGMALVLLATFISTGNAVVRKIFGTSSNSLLEIQWYLFSAVFLLGAGYALLKNAHVRVDFLSSRLSPQARNWIDIVGILAFLTPLCLLMVWQGWPVFERAWTSGEMSSNAGGLVRWPVLLLIPLGFAFLLLQGVSELIKRVAFLQGRLPDALAEPASSESAEPRT